MNRTRRALLALPVLAAAGASRAATLPAPRSLAQELQAALQARRPLLVMASLDGCPYCKLVRDSFLAPLRADTGQPVVQLDMGRQDGVAGFDGRATTHDALLRGWKVKVAPTVLFFGRDGREVAERLVGASIPDFYGAYLQQRLEAALKSTA
jgi:thioredoxin-related protein